MSRNLYAALAFTALFAAPLSAEAQMRAEQPSIRVFYGDLDLSKPAGMQTLQRRLKAASIQVCGDGRGALRASHNDPAHCTQDAVASALDAISKAQNRVVAENAGQAGH